MAVVGEVAYADLSPVVVILFGVVIIAVMVFSIIATYKRRQALRALARAKGLRFYESDPFGLPNRYGDTRLCGEGHSKKASNVIAGDFAGGNVCYFDYKYTTGSGKNSQTHQKSACALHTGYYFTRMLVRPENILDKVAGFFGFDDVDLDQAEFNRKFYVGCSDKKYAYDILTQRVMQFFLDRPGITLEMGWDYLLFHYDGTIEVAGVAALIDGAEVFMSLVPNYVKKDRQLPGAGGAASSASTPDLPEPLSDTFGGIEPKPRRRR